MEKVMYVKFGERCRKVTFLVRKNQSDKECASEAVKKNFENDCLLKNQLENTVIVLQKKVPGLDLFVDIDEDEEIENNAEMKCILVPINEENPSFYMVDPDTNVLIMEENEGVKQIKKETEPSTHANKKRKINVSTEVTTNGLKFPIILPKISTDIEEKIKNVGLLQAQKSLIYFWATDLLNRTDGKPTKSDYFNYAMTIVSTYPELKGGDHGCGIVRNQLSTNIRNRRANVKRSEKKCCNVKRESTNPTPAIIDNEKEIDTDGIDALKELKKDSNFVDSPHVRLLMKASSKLRREWIKKTAKNLNEIIERYPQLTICNLIIFDFLTFLGLDERNVYTKIERMLQTLAASYEITINNEKAKANILTNLWSKLTPKTMKKMSKPLFIVREQLSSTADMNSEKEAAPRIVFYTTESDISAAYLIADESLRIKIDNPSIAKILMCLLASYFSWDVAYPPAYANVLKYLESQMVSDTIKLKPSIQKFIRDTQIKLSALERNASLEEVTDMED